MSPKEQEIITYGKANGKTREEVERALVNFRLGIVPSVPTEPSTVSQIATGVAKGVGDQVRGLQKIGNTVAGAALPGVTGSELDAQTQQSNKELTGLTDEDLKSGSKMESVGKGLAFLASLLSPTNAPRAAVTKTVNMVDDATKGVASAVSKATPNLATDFALEAATPKITQKVATEAAKKGQMTEAGIFKAGEITPNKFQTQIQDVMKPLAEGARTPLEVINRGRTRIGELDAVAQEALTTVDPIFNKATLRSYIMAKVKENNTLVFKTDEQAEKLYTTVTDALIEQIESGKTSALFQARKDFDKIPAVKKLLNAKQKIDGNPAKEAVLEVRGAANDFIVDTLNATGQLPEADAFTAALREEHLIYQGIENLAEKFGKTNVSKSKMTQIIEKVPFFNSIIGNTIGGTAAGSIIRGGMELAD
jgi:hypothetical protein